MFSVTVETSFRASHSLTMPDGIEEPTHEHNWKVQATVQTEKLDRHMLVMDFHLLENLLNKAVTPLTKVGSINNDPSFINHNPSAEAIADYIRRQIQNTLPENVELTQVTVWETTTCSASWHKS